MSLANLAIVVTANTLAARSAMLDLSATARDSMARSGAAVDQFRSDVVTTGSQLQRSSQQMGANFEAANAAIVNSTQQSAQALAQLNAAAAAVKVPSFTEKASAAFGAGVGAGFAATKTWLDKAEEVVAAKTKAIAIGLAIAAVSATAATVYGAYRIISGTLGFITGLFTGSAYQSDSIDAIIKVNDQVKTLQRELSLSAVEAGALQDALGRLGVDKTDYVATWNAAQKAMHANGEELDRLGVKYKDNDGRLLETQVFLGNVKTALDGYREGWDRNAAAVAIGAGSLESVTAALKVTTAELEQSKSRLDEYVLGFGPERQAAVTAYEKAIREFKNESKLMGDGFSAAIADNIMPALTTLATFFKDGFPVAVRAFRYSLATVTSMIYGIKTVFDIVADAAIGSIEVLADGFVALGTAAVKALKGDTAGAAKVLSEAWANAGKTVGKTMDEIVSDATKNRDAMLLAWGLDDRTMSIAEARQKKLAANQGKKAWTPAPAAAAAAPAASEYQKYLQELDREIAKTQQSEYASKRLRAEQLAQNEGITDLTAAYQKITEIQSGDSAKALEAFREKLTEEAKSYEFETAILTANTVEREKLVFAMQRQLALEKEIEAFKRNGKPLDDVTIAKMQEDTQAAVNGQNERIDKRDQVSKSFSTGLTSALQKYKSDAEDMAKFATNLVNGSLSRMEDAFIDFAKTGKLSLGSLFGFMAEEFLRQVFKMKVSGPLSEALLGSVTSGGGWVSALSALFGGKREAGGPVTGGTPYLVGEKGPELFVPSARGSIVPNSALAAAGTTIDARTTIGSVGAGVSRSEMSAALRASQAQTIAQIRRLNATGKTI